MFRGRRRRSGVMEATSSPRCVMCGADVAVDAAGFCPLGHFIGLPAGAVEPAFAPALGAAPEPGAVFTEPTIELPTVDSDAATAVFAPIESTAAPGSAEVAPVQPPAVEAFDFDAVGDEQSGHFGQAGDAEQSYSNPFAGFESPGDVAPAYDTTKALPTFDSGESEAQHALSELLAMAGSFGDTSAHSDSASALDVDASQLPDHQPIDDAVDIFEPLPAPDDDADEAVEARRRAAGLLGGGLLTLLAFAGSIAILPPL